MTEFYLHGKAKSHGAWRHDRECPRRLDRHADSNAA